LQAVIDAIESKKLKNVEISFVLSNKKEAFILQRAKNHNINSIFLDSKDKTREEYDKENRINIVIFCSLKNKCFFLIT
jgi:phosphoribosylglycinamide formyltransferase-1